MLKQERRLFLVYLAVLVILYVMSSTNLIIKEKKTEIYPISVIVEDSKDEYYQNFKKGMEQAAKEYHVDVNFITLYDTNDMGQQTEMLEREMEDGAKAVVVTPVDTDALLLFMEEKKPALPLLLLGTLEGNDLSSANISMDAYRAGNLLGEAFKKENSNRVPVYFFTEGLRYQSNSEFYKGISAVLEPEGYDLQLFTKESEDTFSGVMEQLHQSGKGQAAIIALDSHSLVEVIEILKKNEEYRNDRSNLYGMGSALSILNALDGGLVSGVVTASQFDLGYLSIQKAVEAIQNGSRGERILLDAFYIRREDLRDPAYEKMLYPIE